MPQPSKSRKSATLVVALLLAAGFIWFGYKVVVIGGTKASFSFVEIKSPPGGTTTSKSTSTTSTSTTRTSSTTPAAPGAEGR